MVETRPQPEITREREECWWEEKERLLTSLPDIFETIQTNRTLKDWKRRVVGDHSLGAAGEAGGGGSDGC